MAMAISVIRNILNRYAHTRPIGINQSLCFQSPRAISMIIIQMNDCLSPVHPHTILVPVPVSKWIVLGSKNTTASLVS